MTMRWRQELRILDDQPLSGLLSLGPLNGNKLKARVLGSSVLKDIDEDLCAKEDISRLRKHGLKTLTCVYGLDSLTAHPWG